MAFSSRFGKAKAAAPAPAASPAEDFAAAPPSRAAAPQPDSSYDTFTRRQEVLAESRRKAAEEDAKREAYEQEKARQATIAKSRAEAARRAMRGAGIDEAAAGNGGYPAQANSGTGGFGWKKREGTAAAPQSQQGGLSFGRGAKMPSSAAPARPERPRLPASVPSHDVCEQAVAAMISRTPNGMKEGLQMLGLPDYPLSFVPGRELVLCGHNVREEVNEMIHNWMTDEKEDFASCLGRIKDLVSKPILTEEELDMLDSKDDWKKVIGPDGNVQFQQRQPGDVEEDDDDDDDEVIDLDPAGARIPGPGPPNAANGREGVNRGFASSAPKVAEPTPVEEDYYALLGVDPASPLHEIRTKFRALVLTAHPEKGGDAKRFHLLNKAYGVLSDQKKRDEYDRGRR